ncbi:hypothetical protein GCM10010271_13790 [Streptomyces kurssanovii]|nr:hypothetical protein GCM10010271_13790 [Streptomyces kurssanovii]
MALCVESSVTPARAAVVNPTAVDGFAVRLRGLRCDAKAGISFFRGPPTGLAVGFGRTEDALRTERGTVRFTPVVLGGSPVPNSLGRSPDSAQAARSAWFAGRGAGRLVEHASQLVRLL